MSYAPLTKNGYNLFEMSSMIQKAIRRSDVVHAAYAANELSVNYRNYLWKRLITVSIEDCYGIMTKEIMALKEADDFLNKKNKKGDTNDLPIAKAVVLLCMAKKNRDADYVACNFMWGDRNLTDKEYDEFVDYEQVKKLEMTEGQRIPDYVFDCHTLIGKKRGKTAMDMFITENQALEPHEMNLFDTGDFGGWAEHQQLTGHLRYADRIKQQKLKAVSNGTDPTNNGTTWPNK